MTDFTTKNMKKITDEAKIDFHIKIGDKKSLYNVRRRFEQVIRVKLRESQNTSEVFQDFIVLFDEFADVRECQKTPTCHYQARSDNLRRHELTCTDQQVCIEKQVAYGIDRTPVKSMIELGILPQEAASFRKTFVTSYDIEAVEDMSGNWIKISTGHFPDFRKNPG